MPVTSALVDGLFELHQDPGIARWYAGVWSRQHAWQRAVLMEHGWLHDGVHKWLAYDRGDGSLIGRGGLSYAEVDGSRRLEIGWAVRERLWGRGYASEIGDAALKLAFDELSAPEVVSFTEIGNARSRAVMRRLGFRYEREIRHRSEPFAFYSLSRHEREQG